MQLISQEKDIYEFKIDHLEDLWVLSEFITPNNIIYSKTMRKVAIGNDKTKQVTKIIYIELKVNKTLFDSELLRIQGDILNETEFTAVGQSHTLSFQVNDTIKIKKDQILKYEEKILNNALNSKKSLNLGVLFDKDELILFEFSEFNFKVLTHEKNLGSKKGYSSQIINDEEEKYKIIEPMFRKNYSNIILAGPGNFKDKLKKYLDSKGIKSLSYHFYDVSPNLVQKLITKIFESGILEENQISREQTLIDELLLNIEKNEKSSYGFENSYNSVIEGSVEKLLISTKLISKYKDDNKFNELQELFHTLEQLKGELIIINSKHEPGQILDGLGSICAILRY